jgi:biotin carboxylase
VSRRGSVLYVGLRRIPREGLESLLAARSLGLDVVIMARSAPTWARPLVTEVVEVDTFDTAHSLDVAAGLARRHDVRGVASFTEADVVLVARIAEALGLRGMTPEAAARSRNKVEMKQALAPLGHLLPRFRRVTDLQELRDAVQEIGLPAVVKPTGASGSKGIFTLTDEADLAPAIDRLQQIARPEFDAVFREFGAEFIVEEYLSGPEVSVEGFVADGRFVAVGVTDKLTTEGFHLELRHVFPSRLAGDRLDAVLDATRRIVGALGMDQCAIHLEGKVTPAGFRFIEVAARPAGDYIATHAVPLSSGVPYFENVVRVATGLPLELEPTAALVAGIHFVLAEREGCFEGLAGLEPLLREPGYEHVFVEVPDRADVQLPPRHFGLQRVAAIVAKHPHREALDELLDRGARSVTALIGAPAYA